MHLLQTLLPDAKQEIKNCDKIWHQGKDYDTYMAFVTCVKIYLGLFAITDFFKSIDYSYTRYRLTDLNNKRPIIKCSR